MRRRGNLYRTLDRVLSAALLVGAIFVLWSLDFHLASPVLRP